PNPKATQPGTISFADLAAAAAPDLLPSRVGQAGLESRERQSQCVARTTRTADGRGPQGAGLLAVRELARPAAPRARSERLPTLLFVRRYREPRRIGAAIPGRAGGRDFSDFTESGG